jgi:hypothetical protein
LIRKYFDNPPPKNSSSETISELLYNKKLAETVPEEYIQFMATANFLEDKIYSDFASDVLGLHLRQQIFF